MYITPVGPEDHFDFNATDLEAVLANGMDCLTYAGPDTHKVWDLPDQWESVAVLRIEGMSTSSYLPRKFDDLAPMVTDWYEPELRSLAEQGVGILPHHTYIVDGVQHSDWLSSPAVCTVTQRTHGVSLVPEAKVLDRPRYNAAMRLASSLRAYLCQDTSERPRIDELASLRQHQGLELGNILVPTLIDYDHRPIGSPTLLESNLNFINRWAKELLPRD